LCVKSNQDIAQGNTQKNEKIPAKKGNFSFCGASSAFSNGTAMMIIKRLPSALSHNLDNQLKAIMKLSVIAFCWAASSQQLIAGENYKL